MSERLNSATVADKAIVHAELPKARVNTHGFFDGPGMGLVDALSADTAERANIRQDVDRTFEMPSVLYGATVALYLGFIAMLGIGFSSPELAIPMAIFAIFIVGLFAAPAAWLRLGRKPQVRAKSFGDLLRGGIDTNTGRLKGRDAVVQMMILPVLIVAWGSAVLVIAATVSA
ncbi:hypothetical protein [Citromicrobium bathyomarinum]|uniref:hypothetical protein n=1 Tax=Citromicrobium bathyomarinum TaxID=72174 RepID=UPI00315A18CD